MNLDWIWLIIAFCVTALELIAHFYLHNRELHTISNRVKLAQKITGLPGHLVFGAIWILLGLHLEGVLW